MFWGRQKTLEELRLEAAKGDGACGARIYFGDGFVECKEYPVSGNYCQVHQPGVNARMLGVFQRLPPPPEPIFKLRENADPSGNGEWSDGRFRTRRGRYARGGTALKMTPEAIYSRRTKRKYRARKKAETQARAREAAQTSAQCPHCREQHDAGAAHTEA